MQAASNGGSNQLHKVTKADTALPGLPHSRVQACQTWVLITESDTLTLGHARQHVPAKDLNSPWIFYSVSGELGNSDR